MSQPPIKFVVVMECLDPYRPKRSQGIWVEYVRPEMAIYDLNPQDDILYQISAKTFSSQSIRGVEIVYHL